jgi:hypothetical protein
MSENEMIDSNNSLVPETLIISKIYLVRSRRIMLDMDLAELYGVETRHLKQAVKRNPERFPEDFMFELNNQEFNNLRSQFVTSSWGGTRYNPIAFTEQGIAMLSSVLKSKTAVLVNIRIIRVYSKMRQIIDSNKELFQILMELKQKDIEHDQKIEIIFEYLRQLEQTKQSETEQNERIRIGFKQKNE